MSMTKTEATAIANRIMAQGHQGGGYFEGAQTRIYHLDMYNLKLDMNGGAEVRKVRISAKSAPKVRAELVEAILTYVEFGDGFKNEVF